MQTTSKAYQDLISLLKKNNITYQLYEHLPVYTSEDAAKIRQTSQTQGAKALVFLADKKPILLVLPGNKKVDTKKFKQDKEIEDLRFASKEEVLKITGLEVGAIPPFGNVLGVETYVDKSLLDNQEIVFNAGAHTKSIKMQTKEYLNLVKPRLCKFALKIEI